MTGVRRRPPYGRLRVTSGDRDKDTFKHRFAKTTLVICTIHPDSMRLKVVVK